MINKVGVIGAGQMGSGIAHVLAMAGLSVRMLDREQSQLDKGVANIGKNLDRQIAKGKATEGEKGAAIGRIATTLNYADLADCDLVVEAATENEAVKKQIFAQLC